MKTFKVYKHPVFGYAAAKVGISYPALLLGWVWLIANKLRGLGILFLFIPIPLLLLLAFISNILQIALDESVMLLSGYLIALVIPAFMGNEWLANKYEEDGYQLVKTIQADNKKAAIALAENDDIHFNK